MRNENKRKISFPSCSYPAYHARMSACVIPLSQPMPIADLPPAFRLRVVSAAGAGFPSPAHDWEETAIDLVALLRLDRAASFVFRVSGQSMIDAGIYDDDVVVVDRDA